jgi:hypothetical protein
MRIIVKKQEIFILIASLVTSYASLEAASQKEMLIARLDAKGQSIHIQELAKKQEAEEQRIAAQKEPKADRLKKQDLIHNLETNDDNFMADSIPVSKEE